MDEKPTATFPASTPDATDQDSLDADGGERALKWQWEQYIDFCASGGLKIAEDGNPIQMTAQDFANEIKVYRTSLYRWPKMIPNFHARVAKRRKDIYSENRINQIYKAIQLKAMGGDVQAADLILRNFDPNYRTPSSKTELDVGRTLADLMQAGLRRRQAIEGDIVAANSNSQ